MGAGAAVTASAMAAADAAVVESDVVIKMDDGSFDAAVSSILPPVEAGRAPVIFADALGLRPAFRDADLVGQWESRH